MRLLLDTHVWIWAFEGSASLGPRIRKLIVKASVERYISPVSTLEISRLVAMGAITLGIPLEDWLQQSMSDLKLRTMEFTHEVAAEAYTLPGVFHSDPADRQLVASARIHDCQFVTADKRILAYPHLRVLDARK